MPDLIDSAYYKTATGTTGTVSDGQIAAAITAASALINDECEREFVLPSPATATRRFRVDDGVIDLAPYDLRVLTTVTLHPESSSPQVLAADELQLLPIPSRNGVYQAIELAHTTVVSSQHTVRFGHALADVAGTWGFAEVPDDVKRACVETVRSLIQHDAGGWLNVNDQDTRDVGLPVQGTRGIPTAARAYLQPFTRYVSIG